MLSGSTTLESITQRYEQYATIQAFADSQMHCDDFARQFKSVLKGVTAPDGTSHCASCGEVVSGWDPEVW